MTVLLCVTDFTEHENLYVHVYCYTWHFTLAMSKQQSSVCIYTYHMSFIRGFPGGSDGKEFACKAGGLGWMPDREDPPGGGNVYSLLCRTLRSHLCLGHCK